MIVQEKQESNLHLIGRYIGHFVIWVAFTVSQVALMLWIHELAISLSISYGLSIRNPWLPRAVDMWSMVFLGIMVLISMFITESYLHHGLKQKGYWKRVGIVALVELIVAVVLYGLDLIL